MKSSKILYTFIQLSAPLKKMYYFMFQGKNKFLFLSNKDNRIGFVSLAFCLLLYHFPLPLSSSEVKINVNTNNINKIFKRIQLKNLNSILFFDSEVERERNISYTNCGSEFPELPGNFPCSFLSDEFLSESPSVGSSPGGNVFIQRALQKNEFGGTVYVVSSGEEEEFKLNLFYSKDRYIRAYSYKDHLIFFHWVGKESKSLIEIFKIRLNDKKQIQSIRRIRFDE